MTSTAQTNLPPSPAAIYDARFVPALFAPWAVRLVERAGVEQGHRVLDVACGTGALTRAIARRVGPEGSVVGLDLNPEMLAVARAKGAEDGAAAPTWVEGAAEELAFEASSFDRVLSQFGMMFFDRPVHALREMQRVLRKGGRLTVSVCAAVDTSPGYAVLTELIHRLFGPEVAEAFRAPFRLGDPQQIRALAREAGLLSTHVATVPGRGNFASVADLVSMERACAWTLGDLLDEDQFERLLAAAEVSLRPFVTPAGDLVVDLPAVVLEAYARD
ncbi:MAG: class I SAM-dependent methyltransferase [Myxococcota bacterium]